MTTKDSRREKRKRIAVIGGGAHTIPTYRALLKRIAHDFDIILYSEFHMGSELKIPDYKIKSVPSWKMPRRLKEIWFGLMIAFDQLVQPADIIHAHSTFPSGLAGIMVGKLFRKPVLVSLDAAEGVGIEHIGFGDLLHRKRTKVNQFVLKHASAITTLTAYHKNLIEKNLNVRKKIKVVPRGVNSTQFQFEGRKINSPVRFLNVAYIHAVKDQETLLRCFQILSRTLHCTLTQVGQDYMDGQMQKLAEELNLDNVNFVGFVNHDGIQKFYKQADVLLHTSLYESQAVVVSEALASGVLVCGTQVGLLADLSDRCTITSKPGDYEGLAKKVMGLLSDPASMETLRENGKKWSDDHDHEWTANQFLTLYHELLFPNANPGKG